MSNIAISELVTDGNTKWLETQRYFGFSRRQARRMFKDYLREHGLVLANG